MKASYKGPDKIGFQDPRRLYHPHLLIVPERLVNVTVESLEQEQSKQSNLSKFINKIKSLPIKWY